MDESHSMPSQWERELARLREETESLRAQLADSQETLCAIQEGAIDALVIDTPEGPRVFTLQGGEHPYRALIEQMREGAATLTPQGVVHYCNQRCAEMLKLPLERVMGGRMEDFVAPADRAALAAMLRAGAGRTELALRAGDATEVPVLVSAILLRAEGPAAVCLVVTDLTERKRHESEIRQLNEELEQRVVQRTAQLAAAKDLYAVTLASIGDGVIVTDAQGRVTFLNGEAERLTGWTSREAEGRPLTAVFHIINAQTRQPVEDSVATVFRMGTVVGLANHTLLLAKDGREIPIADSGAPIRQSDGTVQGVVLVFRDVTEQKQAEELLRESEQRFRTMAELIPQLAWMARPDGHIFWYNRRWYEYTGTTPEQMEGWGWQAVHDPDELPRVLERWKAAIAAGKPWEDTFPLRRNDGTMRPHLSRAVPVYDQEGRVMRWFGTNTDITERIELEESLQRAKEASDAANMAKSRFLANMSHELRTPMNAILGLIDVALSKDVDPAVKDCLQTARGSADLLLALLNDLLDSAKIDSGKLELESAPFSLRRMLEQTAQVLAIRASEKGLAFHCRVSEETPDVVTGDRTRLQQVLLNLAGNAVKFAERGEVEVSLRARSHRAEAHLEFAVRDTGIGIPPSGLELVFQPFAQADASMTRRFGGTGLGLSISKSLVEMMGGRIWVESEVGKGSTFYFTVRLPVAKKLPSDTEAPVAVSPAARAPLRILLAEDNPANQKLVSYILQERGHLLEIASNGQEAIELTAHNRCDVILMDVEMPGMNGLEATAAIRKCEPAGRRVPIIAMTAHAMKGDRERCLAAGMDGYLSKPIKGHEMIALIESLTAGAASATPQHAAPEAASPLAAVASPMPPPASRESTPTVDASVFDLPLAMKRCDSRQAMLRSMVESFFQDVDTLFPQMRSALARGDAVEVGHLGHRLKGTVVYLGANRATEAAERVEQSVRTGGQSADAEDAINALERECEILGQALAAYRATAGASQSARVSAQAVPPP